MRSKLVLVKSKCNNPKYSADCQGCALDGFSSCGAGKDNAIICESGYNYKLQEAIQTKYELAVQLYEVMLKNDESEHYKIMVELARYIRENKPDLWVTCLKDNTKVGDTVRYRGKKELLIVEHIYREHNFCSIWNVAKGKTEINFKLDYLEINIKDKR
jgi:hypothetical protein